MGSTLLPMLGGSPVAFSMVGVVAMDIRAAAARPAYRRFRLRLDTLARVMSSAIGRNEPCPCGSGKKFKRCCGATSTGAAQFASAPLGEPVQGWARAHAVWPKTRKALTDHAVEWVGKEGLHAAFEEFGVEEIPERQRSDWFEILLSWQLYDWVPLGEKDTVADRWLARGALDPIRELDVVQMIQAVNAEPLSFFQIQAIDRGRGAVLRDLLTGEERFVVDRSMSESLSPWTVLFARLAPFGSITILDAVGPRPLPPNCAEDVVSAFEEDFETKAPVTRETLRALGRDIVHLYQEIVDEDDAERSRIPELHNTDGHLLVLCKETWTFGKAKRAGVIDRIRKLGLEPDGEPDQVPLAFTWSRKDADGSSGTVLGRIVVSRDDVTLETNSKERLAIMNPKLMTALDGIATHVRSEEQSQDELRAAMAKARDESAGEDDGDNESAIPPELQREVVRGYLEKHYATWPDVALPALGGKTPREALTSKAGRAEVEALIKDMEHRSHASPMESAYDFDNLRRSLGLPAARGPLG